MKRGLPEICDDDRPTGSVVDFGIDEWRAGTQQYTSSQCGKEREGRAHRPNENKLSRGYRERSRKSVELF